MDSHFIDHNKENPGHCLFIGLMDLMVWCYECTQDKSSNKVCSIESKKTFDYLKILRKFIFEEEEEITEVQKKEFEEALGKENDDEEIKKKYLLEQKKRNLFSY
jgi:hypothetical protein